MKHVKSQLHICSVNCQGLRQYEKRLQLYMWAKHQRSDILMLQETHFSDDDNTDFQHESDFNMFYSNGTKQSKGVAILINKNMNYKVIDIHKDNEGRCILLNIEIYDKIYTVCNIYAPNIVTSRNTFFKNVNKFISNNSMGR